MVRRLTWLGSDLCDYNGPLLSEQFLRHAGVSRFALLWRDVIKLVRKTTRRRFDFIDLQRMPETVGAEANPFLALKVLAHPSAAHVASLGENWDAFYTAKRSSATRKTERKKLRQLGEHGEVRFVPAQESGERAWILNTLMEQKSQWFAKQGVKNIFDGAGRREFFLT
jgi:CelD/BcsL family acetyltransferase involved in cellulose biosynthesis